MAGRIVARLAHPPADNIEWVIYNDYKSIEGPFQTSISELRDKTNQYPITVLVPSIALQILHVNIPRTSRSNLLKAIPYALEEQVADDMSNIHFAILETSDEKQTIAVVAKSLMDTWLKQLTTAGIHAESLIPDVYALPEAGTAWFAVCDKDSVLCSCGHNLKFVTDKMNFYTITRLFLENEQYPKPSHIEISCDNVSSLNLPPEVVSINGVPIHCTPPQEPLIRYLAQHLPKSSMINLLQGDYQATHTHLVIKRTWGIAAAIVAIWCVSFFGKDLLQYHQLNKQQTILQQQVDHIYHQVFPTATAVTTPKLRFERELKRLQVASQGSTVLSLIAQAAPVVKSSSDITIESLEFKEDKLTIKVRSNNFQNIEGLVNALKQKQLTVAQSEAQRSDNVATSNIVIRKH